MGCSSCFWDYLLFVILALIGLVVFMARDILQKLFWFSSAKWDNSPKDVLILHCPPRGRCIPCISPFVLKVETYLRMAKIPYEIDTEDTLGPAGKTPWITLNSVHVTDSQQIIEFLNKKFDKDLNIKLNPEQKALSRTIRVMIEEHAFWGMAHWRWIGGVKNISKVICFPAPRLIVLKYIMGRRFAKNLWGQGLGRIHESDMIRFVEEDLRNLSTLLGNKKFLNGDEPCEDDAGVFGLLAQMLWAAHESPYEKILNEELHNLKSYCIRMREKYWPDWDELCVGDGTS